MTSQENEELVKITSDFFSSITSGQNFSKKQPASKRKIIDDEYQPDSPYLNMKDDSEQQQYTKPTRQLEKPKKKKIIDSDGELDESPIKFEEKKEDILEKSKFKKETEKMSVENSESEEEEQQNERNLRRTRKRLQKQKDKNLQNENQILAAEKKVKQEGKVSSENDIDYSKDSNFSQKGSLNDLEEEEDEDDEDEDEDDNDDDDSYEIVPPCQSIQEKNNKGNGKSFLSKRGRKCKSESSLDIVSKRQFYRGKKKNQESSEQEEQDINDQQIQVKDTKNKTIRDYVADIQSTQRKKSQQNSRIQSRVQSRRPSMIFKDDMDYDEDQQQSNYFLKSENNLQVASKQPVIRQQVTTTSSSFLKRPNTMNKKWSEKETSQFYRYLRHFGTDFTTIQSYLKTKTITQIKNKFNKEEKKNPQMINDALRNPNRKGLSKLKENKQLQTLKLMYDKKFDLKSQMELQQAKVDHEQYFSKSAANLDMRMIKSGEDQQQQQQQLDEDQKDKKNNYTGFLEDEFQQEDKFSQIQRRQSEQQKQQQEEKNQEKQQQQKEHFQQPLQLTMENLQKLRSMNNNFGLAEMNELARLPFINIPKHRKDSLTSNDSVTRHIEENLVQIYNNEVERHNSNMKQNIPFIPSNLMNNSQYLPQCQEDSGELSANTSTKSLRDNINNIVKQQTTSNQQFQPQKQEDLIL